mgnify:CR=1 FL=1
MFMGKRFFSLFILFTALFVTLFSSNPRVYNNFNDGLYVFENEVDFRVSEEKERVTNFYSNTYFEGLLTGKKNDVISKVLFADADKSWFVTGDYYGFFDQFKQGQANWPVNGEAFQFIDRVVYDVAEEKYYDTVLGEHIEEVIDEDEREEYVLGNIIVETVKIIEHHTGIYVLSNRKDSESGDYSIHLTKILEDNTIEEIAVIDGDGNDCAVDMIYWFDGMQFLILANTDSGSLSVNSLGDYETYGDSDIALIKINIDDGSFDSIKFLGGSGMDKANAFKDINWEMVTIFGETNSTDQDLQNTEAKGQMDGWVFEIFDHYNGEVTISNQHRIGGEGNDSAFDGLYNNSQLHVIVGNTDSNFTGAQSGTDILFVKVIEAYQPTYSISYEYSCVGGLGDDQFNIGFEQYLSDHFYYQLFISSNSESLDTSALSAARLDETANIFFMDVNYYPETETFYIYHLYEDPIKIENPFYNDFVFDGFLLDTNTFYLGVNSKSIIETKQNQNFMFKFFLDNSEEWAYEIIPLSYSFASESDQIVLDETYRAFFKQYNSNEFTAISDILYGESTNPERSLSDSGWWVHRFTAFSH